MKAHFSTLLRVILMALIALLSSAKDFDFFYFVQQWPGSYCDTKRSCCYPNSGKPAADFGIHGLWPNNNDGSYPSYCDKNSPFNQSEVHFCCPNECFEIAEFTSQMQRNWPTLACPSGDGFKFWGHEWDKHGTCSESVFGQRKYFETALGLKEKLNLLQILKDAGIEPDGELYRTKSISDAIRNIAGYTPGIECNVDEGGKIQLYQIYLCVDSSGQTFFECPLLPSSQCASRIEFPSF